MLLPFHSTFSEAGCDEAGRGCLAGPVFAAAVILPDDYKNEHLNDSKKLTVFQREKLRKMIENDAVEFAIGRVENDEIDKINILNASFKSMHFALSDLNTFFDHILVDGNRFLSFGQIKHTCIVKGDGKYMSIAAASILAKTYRDECMQNYHLKYPEYKWNQNKGYPTLQHRKAIQKYGITEYHRKTFSVKPVQQLVLFDEKLL
ncbi:MAG: ribonuclease HII [Saprospiraceae bacterium]|nr:ribonuclease HII [Saprospiraceae bacterium]MBK6785805.1 ribonuclease HII [Saprospiraceae bacterium]MBK7525469.1 ribonuclease HII [Saprospiraceae bacterium]MBK8370441.1 ribonuclease HII [Saprospiraceae bacterium]MBK8546637.1 ribonuclease HII [Saprospiraceae bacterium]